MLLSATGSLADIVFVKGEFMQAFMPEIKYLTECVIHTNGIDV